MKKRIATLLSLTLAFSTLLSALADPVSAQAAAVNESEQTKAVATFKDVESHWAKEKIAEWSSQGVVSGASANEFKPDQQVTRAEWAAIVNRMFQLNEQKPQAYTDVATAAWYADAVNTATTAGYMKGYTDGTFKPNATLTRQEAVASLSRLLKWETNNTALTYKDSADIQSWATSSVSEAVYLGVVKGYEEGTFKPNQSLTRAEAVSMLDRAFDTYGVWYGKAGTYGSATKQEVIQGNVIVNVQDVTLQNIHIKGDLILTQGVGEGDVHLNKVKVDGKTLIYGGGKNSIHVNDSVLVNVVVDKRDGSIRLVAKGTSKIQEIVLQSPTAIDAYSGVDVSRVRLSEQLPAQSDIRLNGYFNTVEVEAYSIKLQVPQGSIKQLNVAEKAKDTTIEASKEAEILSLVLDAAVKVVGEAVIKQATINAEGSSFDKAPEQLKVGDKVTKDVKVTIGGKDQAAGQSTNQQPGTNNDGASGGSSGGGSTGGSGGGTSGGGSNSGNEGTNQGSWFQLELNQSAYTVGEVVYGKSPRSGKAYLIPETVSFVNLEMIQIAVEEGIARQVDIKADGSFNIATDGFKFARYQIVVFDSKNYYSYPQYFYILDDVNTPLKRNEFRHSGSTSETEPEKIHFIFNRKVEAVPGVDLNQSVLLATYEDKIYRPIGSVGKITIKDNVIEVVPTKLFISKKFSLKIAEGVVRTPDTGELNQEREWKDISHFTRIKIVDPSINPLAVKKGTRIPFLLTHVSSDNIVYLVHPDVSGTQETFDRQVENGWANKVIVPEDKSSEIYYMETSNLSPGNYMLKAWLGHGINITITE
ncbi:S-layer homology domain-containing protein [Paenibacillus agilis]|uniref:S-layer homology domain-containing protein n=1 Tax=Paenibacillus agilis TaxID=3020863 RepID=A0A559IL49_9BACL|nr:S-layer homology domain-containing protein [Paenibacillus agilis]TVX88260.1 S-layer homology domain-containing protein [Paenibacillus agilis]